MQPETQSLNQSLAAIDLFKAMPQEAEDGPWKFAGIASDETEDVVGDALLKSILDISYAQKRGYVNWDHQQDPASLLGYLTSIKIIDGPEEIETLQKSFGRDISPTASVYVEGELYKTVKKAQDIYPILQAAPANHPGLGISLEGGIRRYKDSGKPAVAIVRGIAFSHMPTHTETLVTLRKSLTEQIEQPLQKGEGMSFDQAVLWVLQKRPNWTGQIASDFVKHTIAQGAN